VPEERPDAPPDSQASEKRLAAKELETRIFEFKRSRRAEKSDAADFAHPIPKEICKPD
jgi:hypothetical protein